MPATVGAAPTTIVVDGKTFALLDDESKPAAGPKMAKISKMSDLTLDELADALRPILGRDGKRYQAVDPEYDLATAVKNDTVLGNAGSPGNAPGIRPDYLFDPNNPGNPQYVDFRTADSTAWPYSAVVFIQGYNGGKVATCSASYVGAHTAITAAHCVRVPNSTSYGLDEVFTPDAVGVNGSVTTAPYGQFDPPSNPSCYDWWYPSGWDTSNGDWSYDYAVFDFRRCGNPTINSTGWMGTLVNWNSFPSVRHDGFPTYFYNNGTNGTAAATDPNGLPGCRSANSNGYDPFLCGQSGPGDLQNSFIVESDTVSTTPQDSGGPWWVWYNGDARVVGVHRGEESYGDAKCGFNPCYRDMGHLIDTAFWNFLQAHSEL